MALIAQGGNRRHVQQPRVLRAVRCMAGRATLGPDRSVLERERPAHIRVAFCADRILVGRVSEIDQIESAVRVVAIGALDQAFIHPVVERHVELGLLVSMAAKAKSGLRADKKIFL